MTDLEITLGKGGFALFTIGLIIGIAIPRFRNSRMALSAHLTAVQMGPALIVFAFFWQYFGIPPIWSLWLSSALLLSSFTLVAGLALAAAFGASKALPIAGKGFSATKAKEQLVTVIVSSSSIIMLIASLAICGFMIAS